MPKSNNGVLCSIRFSLPLYHIFKQMIMLTKNRIKEIKSLEQKKFRKRLSMFVAEGPKLVLDLMPCFRPSYAIATHDWLRENRLLLPQSLDILPVSQMELERCSLQQHPQDILCVFQIPFYEASLCKLAEQSLVLVLDGVQDPGNLGTIIRLADWFGIQNVFCSLSCADIYNPKTVQATMGSIARVRVHYEDLPKQLGMFRGNIYGTFLNGEDIYESPLSSTGIIIMGNEGNGISQQVAKMVNKHLYIPPFPIDAQTGESLNVAMATAIVCAEFRRRQR